MLAYRSVQVEVSVHFLFIYWLIIFYIKASGYPKNIHALSQHIPDLQIHIRRFLYDQLNPDSEVFGMDIDLNVQRFLQRFMSKFTIWLLLFIMHQVTFQELEECDVSIFEPHQIGEEKECLEMIVSLLNVNQKMRDFRHWVLPRYRFFCIPP